MGAPTSSSRPTAPDLRVGARQALERRIERLRRYGWHIAQCAVAGAVAYLLAHALLGHPQPFFAPVAAIVSLGLSYGQRLRRVGEVTIGIALGVLIGDVFANVFGTGAWQLLLAVVVAMTLAIMLDASPLLIIQAGVQSAIVTTLAPSAGAGLGRWLDAVCGGLVALLAAAVVPGSPLRRPRRVAGGIAHELSTWLHDAAAAARTADLDLAYRTLERARRSESALDDLRQATREGLDVARSSPWRRHHRGDILAVADLAVPLDRAVRNARVLLRRTVVVTRRGETLPDDTLALLDALAGATTTIARELDEQREPRRAVVALRTAAADSSRVATGGSLSADVVLAQTRSLVVDLLQLCGVDVPEAERLVTPATGAPRAARRLPPVDGEDA
ncbi:MAG: FUSC family protein [Rhodoferax sp.]|nr:FUSC family protein [Actinomycetota bacterium]